MTTLRTDSTHSGINIDYADGSGFVHGGSGPLTVYSDNERKDKQIAAGGDVIFKPSESQQFGFDAYDASTNNHPEIYPPLEGGSYRPAYKSVAQWQQDNVKAEPMQGVTFRNNMGAPYAIVNGDIVLRGEPQPGETPVYAHVAETDSTTKVVGKLNLLTFEPREISVCLVPVNGATLPNIQTLEKELNKIFKPAVASVKLSTATPINIQYANGENFVHGGSGLLSVYSDDEKAAIKALQNVDNETYYLFVVDNVTRLNEDGTPMKDILAGYMPIGYQCGFLFGSPAAKYVAHELGHGAFGLHHTFSSETESFSAPQYSTDNLMDYAEGATLNHKQWSWMHEKHGSGLFGFLADESEGEYLFNNPNSIFTYLELIHDANAKNQKQLAIPKTNVYFEGKDIQLGDVGKLSFIRIGDITNGKKEEQPLILFYGYNNIFIKPNEISETEIMKDDVKYTKYTFHLAEGVKIPTTEPELTETVALEIMVKTEEKQTLIDYINPFKITTDQLHNIYPNASTETIKAVTEVINKYCNEFEINTPERMAHFLGQIGAETTSTLNQLSENSSYSARRVVEIFGYNKYGHLFEEAVLDETTYNYSYNPINYSCTTCANDAIDKGTSTFSMNRNEILNAYAETKEEKDIVIGGKTEKRMLFNDKPRTDVKMEEINGKMTISRYVTNKSYNEGKLRVKSQYINSNTIFDVTYACRLGNGPIDSLDGSTYKGVGFIHLTGKGNYEKAVDTWNKMHPEDQLTLDHNLIEQAKTDVDLAMKLAMAYWKMKKVNNEIKSMSYNESETKNVSYIVNGGTNGLPDRKKNTEEAFKILFKQ